MKKFFLSYIVFILLAFHFLRNGNLILTILSIIFPLILLWKGKISIILVKIGIIIAMLIWAETFLKIWSIYSKFHIPFKNAALIILLVLAYNLFVYNILSKKS